MKRSPGHYTCRFVGYGSIVARKSLQQDCRVTFSKKYVVIDGRSRARCLGPLAGMQMPLPRQVGACGRRQHRVRVQYKEEAKYF